MNRSSAALLVCVALWCWATTARALEPPLTLAAAQAEARASAPEATALAGRVRAAEIVLTDSERRVRLDPSLSLRYGAQLGSYEEHDVLVGVRWPVDMSGARRFRERAAAAQREQSGFDREAGLRALDEAVAIAVAELAFAQRQLVRAERVHELYRIGVEAEASRFRVGSGTQLDLDGAQLDALGARARVEQAAAAVAVGGARVARLLGRPAGRDVIVDDPLERLDMVERERTIVPEQDPRLRAADAGIRHGEAVQTATRRAARPIPSFGVEFGFRENDIPAGAFAGPAAGGLSALWREYEVGVSIGLPLPLFDRNRESRARARADLQVASADRTTTHAEIGYEAEQAEIGLRATADVHRALAPMAALIERDLALVERAMTTGTLDTFARATVLRRLELAGAQLDAAVRDLRIARARWIRRGGT